MNKIILMGRLTRDPEYRQTPSGVSVANFTVAVNRSYKNKDGNYDADFLPCVAYRNNADFVSRYFKKGNMICVEGRVQVRNYDAQDGSKRYVTEIIVDSTEFTGSKNESSSISNNNGYYSDSNSNNSYMDNEPVPEIDVSNEDPFAKYDNGNDDGVILSDDDLPF